MPANRSATPNSSASDSRLTCRRSCRQGKRAVATRIAADTSAGGFILPNDRVDVIMTRQDRKNPGGRGGYITETILNDVRVLAIDQTIEEKDGEKVVVGQTATLELTPQQAEILTVAQQMSDRLTLVAAQHRRRREPGIGGDAIHLIGGVKRNGAVTVVKNGVAKEVERFPMTIEMTPAGTSGTSEHARLDLLRGCSAALVVAFLGLVRADRGLRQWRWPAAAGARSPCAASNR